MYLSEKYNYIRISLPAMLNEGKDNNKVEIIRDFNAWSWNNIPKEITNLENNLVFQNLQILLGYDELEKWMQEKNDDDKLETLKNKLIKEYNPKKIEQFLDLIYKISIYTCTKKNIQEKYRLSDEYYYIKSDYSKMQDKEKFINDLSNKKKESIDKIAQIDTKLKSKEKLKEELEKRNENLPKYNKLIDIEHLSNVLNKERKQAMNEIEKCNKLLAPKNYIKEKNMLEKEINQLEYIEKSDVLEECLKLQKIFLDCFLSKIENTTTKKELMDLICIFRYYMFIPYANGAYMFHVKELNKKINEVISVLLDKASNEKLINKNILKIENNKEFLLKIFTTRMVNIENIQIEITKDKINLYDDEELENSYEKTKDNLKPMKKTKIFIY